MLRAKIEVAIVLRPLTIQGPLVWPSAPEVAAADSSAVGTGATGIVDTRPVFLVVEMRRAYSGFLFFPIRQKINIRIYQNYK